MAIVQIDRLCWIIEIWIVGWVLIGASVKLVGIYYDLFTYYHWGHVIFNYLSVMLFL